MPSSLRLSALAPLALLLHLGCPLNVSISGSATDSDSTGGTECGDPGTNTNLDCACDPGYVKCNPSDPDAIACCEETLSCPDPNSDLIGDECFCKIGFEWCDGNPDNLDCCAVESTTTTPTTSTSTTSPTGTTSDGTTTTTSEGTTTTTTTTETTGSGTTGGEVCMGEQPPPDSCDGGSYWCTQPDECGPEGSELFRCVDGGWFADNTLAKDSCLFDGYDFSYGCVDNGESIEFICGDGPGTACDGGQPSSCFDDSTLEECSLGKLTHFDCLSLCTEIGDDMGVLYDHGFCGERMGATGCLCCDMGEPGCPV
jgi:hypothetical protein